MSVNKNLILKLIFISVYWCSALIGFAQESIPMGTWRLHVSYNSINSVAAGNGKVYGAAPNGIMALDLLDKSMETYTKVNGLSGAGITAIAFDATTSQLIIGYIDGNVDIIKDNVVTNFDQIKKSITLTGSKKINHISVANGIAYLAADYGVVLFDLQRGEMKETWRDLGTSGARLRITQSTFKADSIFLATDKGIMAGYLGDNLLDFNNWKRFQEGDLDTVIHSISLFDDKIYAGVAGSGLFSHENSTWTKESFLSDLPVQYLYSSGDKLFIAQDKKIFMLNTAGGLTEIASGFITYPLAVIEDSAGSIWIGDTGNGMVSDAEGSFISYLPDGPSVTDIYRLKYRNDMIFAMGGGYLQGAQAPNDGTINIFTSQWSSAATVITNVTDIEMREGITFASSFGSGIQAGDFTVPDVIYNATNSALNSLTGDDTIIITALENSSDGIWAANYDAVPSLHLFNSDNTWESFPIGPNAARYPVNLMADFSGNVWMILDPDRGGGILVFNKEANTATYLTEISGAGSLPDRAVRSAAVDLDGSVWVGTDKGVSYFINPSSVFEPGINGIEPIFEGGYLLREDKVTAIAIDGGNRKWMGTERGVWLFSSSAEDLVYNFTEENSPLLSNIIHDIEINPKTGEVFFATSNGIASFRSDATASEPFFQQVKIFPNPVTTDFTGTIGITGLATGAVVKVTDSSGKLIWQTQANGGTATWNGADYNGKKAATGIYLVFSATQDGNESFVGKIAVIK